MFVESSLVVTAVETFVILSGIIYLYFKWQFSYWERRNVPYIQPSIPLGNFSVKHNPFLRMKSLYTTIKKNGWKYGGVYLFVNPSLIIADLDLIKTILIKDFTNFNERGFFYNEKDDPLSAHLFAIGGDQWKYLRTRLSPTFTSGRMKFMFNTFVYCKQPLVERVSSFAGKTQPLDIKSTLRCYTIDVIGSCAFGLDCDSFKDPDSPFIYYGTKFFQRSRLHQLKLGFCRVFPTLARRLGAKVIPEDITQFFMKLVKDSVEDRERNQRLRRDFLQLLIDLKNNELEEIDGYKNDATSSLTIEEIAAQMFVFFVAGFETSSTVMTFAFYEISKQPLIQAKIRQEINQVLSRHNNQITYEAVHEMKYLQQVIDETLRKYPPIAFLTRKVLNDYAVEGEHLVMEKNLQIQIPVLGIHHDEEYYPDPDKFDPERFSAKNKASRPHFTYLPFGDGPRMCMRFGLLQSKVGLISLLKSFKFTLNEDMAEPLKMKTRAVVLTPDSEVWLNVENVE